MARRYGTVARTHVEWGAGHGVQLRIPRIPYSEVLVDLAPPQEAILIRSSRQQFFSGSPMPVREAARRAGISDGTWRNYESARPIERKASTVAAMAAVLGITPAQLVAAGRRDAAGALEQRTADAAADPAVAAIARPGDGGSGYQALMAEILAGLAAIDAAPGLSAQVRHELREEFLAGLRRSAGEFQRHLRILRPPRESPERLAGNGPE